MATNKKEKILRFDIRKKKDKDIWKIIQEIQNEKEFHSSTDFIKEAILFYYTSLTKTKVKKEKIRKNIPNEENLRL